MSLPTARVAIGEHAMLEVGMSLQARSDRGSHLERFTLEFMVAATYDPARNRLFMRSGNTRSLKRSMTS